VKVLVVGAAGGEVTGSAYYVQTRHARLLVDCGMFQGGKKSEALNRPPTGRKRKLDAVLLTHAHLDHVGRLPLLAKRGNRVPVYATPATGDLAALILNDAVRLQAADNERQNRKRKRAGQPLLDPLYLSEHVDASLEDIRQVPYLEPVEVAPGIQARWAESGHMLGSASIQLLVEEGGKTKRVVFSGDIGPMGIPILRDFEPFHRADALFMESTYGDHDHRPFRETVEEFVAIIQDAIGRGGRVLVPTFAVGRAQLLCGLLAWMFRNEMVEPFPVFLDSPMAIETTDIYSDHRELFDEEMTAFLSVRPMREDLHTLKMCATAEESRRINEQTGPFLVMAGAGMCNAGRILHHFKAHLWKPDTHVLMVGYQGYGSLGRLLVDGAKTVTIHGEKVQVAAEIHTLSGFSAHAGQTDLLSWLGSIAPARPRVVVTHGENDAREALAQKASERFGLEAVMPAMGDIVEV
jgi:metallo-beta-lactamase family protein